MSATICKSTNGSLGLEGTVDGTSLSKTVVVPVDDVFGDTPGSFTATSRADIQGSIRGRVGIAWDRALLYATGGVAFSGFNNSITDTTGFVAPAGTSASFSNTRVGWTVGGGIEYAITNNWSVRAEYRYSDFGHYHGFPFRRRPPHSGNGVQRDPPLDRKPGAGRL